jgi:micrococcal nuclease
VSRLAAPFAGALVALAAVSCRAAPAPAPSPSERAVDRVIDGDTILLAGGERVRVLGIDAPEMRAPDALVRAVALEARAALAEALGASTRVEPHGTDKYRRTLAYLSECGEGPAAGGCRDVGAELIDRGLARAYPSEHPRLADYRAREARARSAGRGEWAPALRAAMEPVPEVVIGPAEAVRHVGRLARVEGLVSQVHRTEKALFVMMGEGDGSFTGVAFRHAYPLFPDALVEEWRGRRIAVTGRVKLYEGRAEIVLEHPDQVEELGPQ